MANEITLFRAYVYRKGLRNTPEREEIIAAAQECTQCNECIRACPNNQPIPEAIKAAAKGDLNPLAEILEDCIGCARCDSACPKAIDVYWLPLSL